MSGKGRNAKSFRLWRRKDRGNVFFMRLPGGAWESTGCTDRTNAEKRAIQRLGAMEHAAVEGKTALRKDDLTQGGQTLSQYAADFFLWDAGKPPRCPWCIMKLTEGKQIGPEHAARQRRLLDRFILTDPIADLPLRMIRKGHVMDFRARVLAKCEADVSDEENPKGKRTSSLVLSALSAIFSLAVSRDELESNPVARVIVRSKGAARGTLTLAELRKLPPCPAST